MSDTPSEVPQTEPLAPVPPAPDAPDVATAPTAALPITPTPATDQPAAVADKGSAAGFRRVLERGPQARIWRITSIVLLILGCVLAPLGVAASWGKNLVTDQSAYLQAVEPLATDPVIIDAVQNRAVAAIDDAITNLNLADKLNAELQKLGLHPTLATLATTYAATLRGEITNVITDLVHKVLTSQDFVTLWSTANTKLWNEFVIVMQGKESGKAHDMNVELSSLVDKAKQKLEASGVSWASQIPEIPIVINIEGNANVEKAQGYYDLLNTLGTWLPWLAIIFLIASIVIAPSRIKGLFRVAGWLAVSMVVLVIALLLGRAYLVSVAPSQPDVTKAFVNQLTVNLRSTVRAILIASIVIAAVAWIFGPWNSATSLRAWLRSLTGRVEDSRWRLGVQIGAGVVAVVLVIILVSLDDPSLWVALLLAVIAALAAVVAASALRRGPTPAVAGDHSVDNADDTVTTASA